MIAILQQVVGVFAELFYDSGAPLFFGFTSYKIPSQLPVEKQLLGIDFNGCFDLGTTVA